MEFFLSIFHSSNPFFWKENGISLIPTVGNKIFREPGIILAKKTHTYEEVVVNTLGVHLKNWKKFTDDNLNKMNIIYFKKLA